MTSLRLLVAVDAVRGADFEDPADLDLDFDDMVGKTKERCVVNRLPYLLYS